MCVCVCVPSCDLPPLSPSATARAVDKCEEAGGGGEMERQPSAVEQSSSIRCKLVTFDVQQHVFRENFRQVAPFQFESTRPYDRIDRVSQLAHTNTWS